MIFFYCNSCKEELEAEDSIRGARMKCPACYKEIEVPQVGVRVPDSGKIPVRVKERKPKDASGDSTDPVPVSEPIFNRFVLSVLAAGIVGVFAFIGVGYVLVQRAEQRRLLSRPKCDICAASGRVPCAVCGGKRQQPCRECSGSGKRKNVRDEDETCFACSGKALLDCTICGGRGHYGCSVCGGTGYLDGKKEKD